MKVLLTIHVTRLGYLNKRKKRKPPFKGFLPSTEAFNHILYTLILLRAVEDSSLPPHGHAQQDPGVHVIGKQRASSLTYKRQRYAGDRKHAHAHPYILDKMETQHRCNTDNHIGSIGVSRLISYIDAPEQYEKYNSNNQHRAHKAHLFPYYRENEVRLLFRHIIAYGRTVLRLQPMEKPLSENLAGTYGHF